MSSTLRPWRTHDRSNTLTDRAIVEYVRENGPVKPRDIARSRYRENVVRLQCQYLSDCDVLKEVARDLYTIPELATEEVSGKFKNQPREEFVDLSGAIDGSVPRITDFSNVGADLLRQLNRDFFEDSSFPYGYLRGSKHRTARRIENVKQYRIERLVREFPRTETLYQQCAHWVRAIVGLHFFPDANHRTAMSSLYTILTENGLTPTADRLTFDWIDVAVTRSKLLRAYHCDVTFSTLWQKDELYQHWLRYFRDNLVATHKESRNIVPSGFLDRVLEFSREERRNW